MLAFLDAALDPDTKPRIRAIAARAGIHPSTWRVWKHNPQFRAWFSRTWSEQVAMLTWLLDKIGLEKARTDFPYWEAMQRKIGGLDTIATFPVPVQVIIRAPRPQRT